MEDEWTAATHSRAQAVVLYLALVLRSANPRNYGANVPEEPAGRAGDEPTVLLSSHHRGRRGLIGKSSR